MAKGLYKVFRTKEELWLHNENVRHFARVWQLDQVTVALGRMGFRESKFRELSIPSFHCMVSMCLQPLPHSLLGSSQLVNESLTDLHLSLAGLLLTFHSESNTKPESFSS